MSVLQFLLTVERESKRDIIIIRLRDRSRYRCIRQIRDDQLTKAPHSMDRDLHCSHSCGNTGDIPSQCHWPVLSSLRSKIKY